ncbi:unnamed protein product [Vicia faba]|uniref:Uncharacterized protein n=1 Tax=Vicia faba TaxID=3906 RepID=A0AAV0YK39_VICFA|nr:unnamed protein product [Vicia faba]
MSCYKLSEVICHEIEAMLARFWWGAKNGERKVHWISWEKMVVSKGSRDMGFCGINEFNTSLYGKHYWRLMNSEDSLVGKVFKGRYYPRSSIEESSLGYAPSYDWRSILSARDLIHKGARWRIGNGEKVRVNSDRWVPKEFDFWIRGILRNIDDETKVSDTDLRKWKREHIFSSSEPEVAQKIVIISLSSRSSKKPGPSRLSCTKLWKKIWSAPVNTRTHNFLWRMSKNILPTKDNLSRKGISLDSSCPLCHTEKESASHLFMHCVFVKQILFSSPLSYRVPTDCDIKDWLLDILSCGDKIKDPVRVVDDALIGVAEKWPKDVHTIQVDAGVSPDRSIVFGGVIQVCEMKIIIAASKEVSRTDTVVAEMLAIRWSLGIAKDLKLDRVLLQSDALGAVDCINGYQSIAVIDHIAEDCRVLLSSFNFASVMFIPRTSNADAHNLVGIGKRTGSRTWLGFYPKEVPDVTNCILISSV